MAALKLSIRKLRASEVTFTVEIGPEPESPEGQFASGDDAQDAATVKAILDAVEAGHVEAWCAITVKATWEGIEGVDHLGGCSHLAIDGQPSLQDQVARTIAAHDMKAQALHYLNLEVQRQADEALRIFNRLAVRPPAKRKGRRNGKA